MSEHLLFQNVMFKQMFNDADHITLISYLMNILLLTSNEVVHIHPLFFVHVFKVILLMILFLYPKEIVHSFNHKLTMCHKTQYTL
jgi:nitrate reductase gamma subunit